MLSLFGRAAWFAIKWTVAVPAIFVMMMVKLVQSTIGATRRLHAKALTTPHPRRYFWVRFGIVPALALLLTAVVVSTAVSPAANLASASGDASTSTSPTPDPATIAAGDPTGDPATIAAGYPTGDPATTNSGYPTADPSGGTTNTPTADAAIGGTDPNGGPVVSADATLPDSARTPGAINPNVTQDDIGQTICVSGWTATVRPSSSVTTALKVEQLQSGYSYNGDMATSDYEEDHLISLELGGSPTSPLNLWPEPYNTAGGARVKDQVENKLHALVCSDALTLAAAQSAIASNWWQAYESYVVTTTGVAPAPAPVAPAPAPPAPAPAPGHPAGATAQCNDGSYSSAAHHQGSCSHHGGVAVFY